jgi:hypothetical protein
MSNKLNISVLVAARDEYIEQLKCILTPLILQGFNSIYQDSLGISQGKKTIYKFQELLKEIPKWNQTILQEESKRIKKKCSYIMDIVTAIFVSNVKILASIRLKGKNENIRVKIPTSDIFIHSIYIETAQQIFYDPFLFYHKTINNIQKNKRNVIEIIRLSVDETIRQMLPFDNILQEYLANALNDNDSEPDSGSESDNESGSESEDSESDSDALHGEKIINELDSDPEDEYSGTEEDNIKKINLDSHGNNIPEPEGNNNFLEDSGSDSGDSITDLQNTDTQQLQNTYPQVIPTNFNLQQVPQQLPQQFLPPPQLPNRPQSPQIVDQNREKFSFF